MGKCFVYVLQSLFEEDLPHDKRVLCDFRLDGQSGETQSHAAYLHFYSDNNLDPETFNITFLQIKRRFYK